MAFEQKPDTGALFRNDRKESDSHPNAKGSATVRCPSCDVLTEYWLSAWTNTVRQGEREGDRYQSLKFSPKERQSGARAARPAAPAPAGAEDDDDIPF